MAGIGYQEVLLVAALAFCIVPLATVVFAVLFFREKRRADGLEAMLRQGGWTSTPGSWTRSDGAAFPPRVTPPAVSLPVRGSPPSDTGRQP